MTTHAGNGASETIQLRPVVPPSDIAHRQFIAAALLLAVLVGFVLAIHVPLGRLLDSGDPQRTADLIQAHGQVQLLGFAGLYVIGMSLRLLPRFAGAKLQLAGLLPLILWSMVVSLVLRAVVMPWFSGDLHDALLALSAAGVMLAAGAFLLLVVATLSFEARHADASTLAFLLGAVMLFTASVVNGYVVIDAIADGLRTLPYLANAAVTQLELLGFLLAFIAGVGLRALPVLVGRERPERAAGFLAPAVVLAALLHAASLLYMAYASYSDAAAMFADAALLALGLCLLGVVWQAGVLRPKANRARPASQTAMWLVRGAFAWLMFAAALMVFFGATSFVEVELFADTDLDAVRHALGAGLITNLILGMSLLILPEFAAERQQANRQRLLALTLAVLVNVAAVLRVAPALAGSAWTADDRNLSMAVAGSLAEAGLLLFAVYLLRLMWRTRAA